jgi:hypothetical protein
MFSDAALLQGLNSFTGYDGVEPLLSQVAAKKAFRKTEDTTVPLPVRDMSLWVLSRQDKRYSHGLIAEVASQDKDAKVRRSAAWALMKLGRYEDLKASADREGDGNLRAWKAHLLGELRDNTLPVDDRPVRVVSSVPFDFNMPLAVEGTVEFRDPSGRWHTLVTGPIANERMIGELTPAIQAESFDSTLVLQKRIRDLNGSGEDHVDGYLLKGVSRQLESNVFRHQYEGLSRHTVYPSGVIGDESGGRIESATASIARVADTHITSREGIGFPDPHSVRGTFKGFVYANPKLAEDPEAPIDGNVQIISPMDEKAGHLVNGIFYGSFRGIPFDVDGDGVVELNGVEMYVSETGEVAPRARKSTPQGGIKGDLAAEIRRLRQELDNLEKRNGHA